jgi:hypothetical protein
MDGTNLAQSSSAPAPPVLQPRKARTKRPHSPSPVKSRNVRRRLDDSEPAHPDHSTNEEPNSSAADSFLEIPTQDRLDEIYRSFYTATGNPATKLVVCAVCALKQHTADVTKIAVDDIRNAHLLQATEPFEHHHLFGIHQALLSKCHVWEEGGRQVCFLCKTCAKELEHDHMPEYALANDLWVGDVPPCLEVLTLPEQMLIARHYVRTYVFKMYPKRGGGVWLPSDQQQRGMRGNVVSFKWNTGRVVDMLEGRIAPRRLDTLADVIAVSFIGTGKIPRTWLRATFSVRRERVLRALQWLKANNPLYADVEIDAERIASLPEDGIPPEILASLHSTDDERPAQHESSTFVPDSTHNVNENGTSTSPASKKRVIEQVLVVALNSLVDNENGEGEDENDAEASGTFLSKNDNRKIYLC